MAVTTTHPFHFFILINEANELNNIKNAFFEQAVDGKYSTKEEWIDDIVYDSIGECHAQIIHFKDHIKARYINEKVNCLELLDAYLVEYSGKEILEKLKILKSTWVSVKGKAENNINLKKYELLAVYNELEDELNKKLLFLSSKEKQSPYPKAEMSFERLVWTGETISLTTMFYRLQKENDNKGVPYLNTTLKNLKQFIHASFLDSNGNELSLSTIDTYMKPEEIKKRLKNSTEIVYKEKMK